MKTALLMSGGMDSVALAFWLKPELAVTVDYGQLAAKAEIAASSAVCRRLNIEHQVVHVDCRTLGSGDMAGRVANGLAPHSDWWPYRNQLLVTVVAMRCVALGVDRLLIGTVASDGSHRDGTPDFIAAMSSVLMCQEGSMKLEAPAIGMSTLQLVQRAEVPAGLLAWAHSCHKSDIPCGLCRGCNKHNAVLRELDGARLGPG